MFEDSKRFKEMLESYMYHKKMRIDNDIRQAIDNLWKTPSPDQEHVDRVKELLYRKIEFEETCREVKMLLRLYLV